VVSSVSVSVVPPIAFDDDDDDEDDEDDMHDGCTVSREAARVPTWMSRANASTTSRRHDDANNERIAIANARPIILLGWFNLVM
jgi:hypothetical protein